MSEIDVALEHVTRRFGTVVAVDDLSLDVRRGEFLSLLGPSGCGKTTTLRLIAGFEHPDEGVVRIAGEDVSTQPPYRRPVNTVFQSYALFPHLSVARQRLVRAQAARAQAPRAPREGAGDARARPPPRHRHGGSRRSSRAASSNASRWRGRS